LLTVDEEMLHRMSELIVAVNRRKHAEQRVASLDDPTQLRALAAEEQRAEKAYVEALVRRGWQSPFQVRRGA
jgi:hypothetical protein